MTARLHGSWGLLLVLAPRTCLSRCRAPDAASAILLVRLLGVRHMAEGLALASATAPTARRWCGRIDAAHAITMVGLAVGRLEYRRAAAVSLAVSGVLAGSEFELNQLRSR